MRRGESNVINLMEALRRSVEKDKPRARKPGKVPAGKHPQEGAEHAAEARQREARWPKTT